MLENPDLEEVCGKCRICDWSDFTLAVKNNNKDLAKAHTYLQAKHDRDKDSKCAAKVIFSQS